MAEIQTVEASSLIPETEVARSVEDELDRIFPRRSVSRILFVVPPDGDANNFSYVTCKLGRYPNFPPYGVGVLAARLRREGVTVDIVNLNNLVLKTCRLSECEEDFNFRQVVVDELVRRLNSYRPDLVGVTCMFSQTHQSMVDVCREIRAIQPEVPLALGGVHVTNSMIDPKTRALFIKDFPMVDLFFLYESDLSFAKSPE
jgi:hypothetical protein